MGKNNSLQSVHGKSKWLCLKNIPQLSKYYHLTKDQYASNECIINIVKYFDERVFGCHHDPNEFMERNYNFDWIFLIWMIILMFVIFNQINNTSFDLYQYKPFKIKWTDIKKVSFTMYTPFPCSGIISIVYDPFSMPCIQRSNTDIDVKLGIHVYLYAPVNRFYCDQFCVFYAK